MKIIDSHFHLWQYSAENLPWISNEMDILKNDFTCNHYLDLSKSKGIKGGIVIQAQANYEESYYLLNLDIPFIKGVVAWADISSPQFKVHLNELIKYKKLVGLRYNLQDHHQRDFMLEPQFLSGIKLLSIHNLTFDILVYQNQLKYLDKFLEACPNNKFVLDHMGKPDLVNKNFKDWETQIQNIAKHKTLYCKISGIFTETQWHQWSFEEFLPYLETIVDCFGKNRIMFGTDWPVCLLSTDYNENFNLAEYFLKTFSEEEKHSFYFQNALDFYSIYSNNNEI